ncbi:AzlD domain-containing protein [Streptosporangium saharense]|uniref:Putative membrane protein n=1 Tax=Streptosporangium saharense TaxID=1706840 RepID=A0A7W7QTP1_9ACTN|nr:AzlD domain-containing protein [Streptosporangium saharense]MBB4919569.1 putative membrane protein [Streptosporangium saharense]
MSVVVFVVGLTVTTYLLRLAGVGAAASGRLDDPGHGVLTAALPVALLAAVVAVQAAPGGHPSARLAVAALVAGLCARRTGFLPAVLLGTLAGALVP